MMFRIKTIGKRIWSFGRNSWLHRAMLFAAASVTQVLLKRSHPKVIIYLLWPVFRLTRGSPRLCAMLRDAFVMLGQNTAANEAEAARIRLLLTRCAKDRKYYKMLCLMAEAERTTKPGVFRAGEMIARKLLSEEGRARIRLKAEKAQQHYPDSVYLLHLTTLCQAMEGDTAKANTALLERLSQPFDKDDLLARRRFHILRDTWRVVDLTAREKMEWLDDQGDYSDIFAQTADASSQAETTVMGSTQKIQQRLLGFREHALQGRLREKYLASCLAEYNTALTLNERIKLINEMLRVGIRHIPDYSPSYDLARDCLNESWAEIETLLEKSQVRISAKEVREICAITALAAKLGFDDRTRVCAERLRELSRLDRYAPTLWPGLPVLVSIDGYEQNADEIYQNIRPRLPKTDLDIRDFLRWAALTGRYEEANILFESILGSRRRRTGMLQYVVILQRQGRYKEALNLTKQIHGQILTNPSLMKAYTSFTLLKRVGELRFLIETARIFAEVPQPTDPCGIVIVMPRNIDQMRRYPILVLRELKRLGWAVVPLVEGLLPKELTTNPQIDVLNGSVRPTSRLTPDAEKVMPDLKDFNFDAAKGSLKWRDLTLSHPLWEDAAINRRRYNMNYDCPRLQEYLTGLAGWTRCVGRTLDYARDQHKQTGLPFACISLFSSRLPDALFRPYCETYGSPDGFFFVHAANGYQNYFTNFSTNISHRFVLRNMTRAPETRSASFPIPANFERYYTARQTDAPEILSRFEDITKIKRSTQGQKMRAPAAEAALEKIQTWRRRGGKVACAFGKVVCDSAVPFDGGASHSSMKDWINHSIATVKGSDTLLLIKPHPHELNDQISTFPTEYFEDLLEHPLDENVILLGHRWLDIHDLKDLIDIGLIYNGTTAIELGIMGVPCLLSGHFSASDYPIGHKVPENRDSYAAYLRFEKPFKVSDDLKERAAVWLEYMSSEEFTQNYRFHSRPVTNKVAYPPWWFQEDLQRLEDGPDRNVQILAARMLGQEVEPGGRMSDVVVRASGHAE